MVLTCTDNLCFQKKYEKYQNFLSERFYLFIYLFFFFFLVVKLSVYLIRRILVKRKTYDPLGSKCFVFELKEGTWYKGKKGLTTKETTLES